jgi:phosphoglycolate phosphatase
LKAVLFTVFVNFQRGNDINSHVNLNHIKFIIFNRRLCVIFNRSDIISKELVKEKSLTRINTVIFDLDGTLIYQPPGVIMKSNAMIVKYIKPDCDDPESIVEKVYADTTCNGGLLVTKKEQIKLMGIKLGIILDNYIVDKGLEIFLGNYINSCSIHTDVKPTLDKLRKMGLNLCIATNGAHDVQPLTIEKFGLNEFFNFIAISSEVKASKDSKTYIDYLIHECGIVPEQSVVVGDTKPDYMLAQALGSKLYIVDRDGLKPEEIPPEVLIDSLDILPELVEKDS